MDDPRLSEEVKVRHLDAEDGHGHNPGAAEAVEDDLTSDCFTSSSNMFRDFAIPNPDLAQAKAALAAWITMALDKRNLSTREAEARTGIAHSEFSRIRSAKLRRFTLDRLFVIFGKLEPGIQLGLHQEPVEDVAREG